MEEQARIICKEMLSQRNYNITEEVDDYIIADCQEDTLIVFFSNENKFNNDQLKYYIKRMNDSELKHCIIIYPNQITSIAKRSIEVFDVEIELFCSKELQFNLTKHRLVPQHEKLPAEEAKKIRKEFGSNLPLLLKNDPVSRFYYFKKNDIIKVTRKDGYITYRLVR